MISSAINPVRISSLPDQENEELKSHFNFIQQETQGCEVKVFNKEKKIEEIATIRLISPEDRMYSNRIIYTCSGERIVGNEYVSQKDIKEEYLNYELICQGKRLGHMFVRIKQFDDYDPKKPAKELFIDTLAGSSGGGIGNVGMSFIKFAIELSHKKGFKGAIRLDSDDNSPGFYWLAGLKLSGGDEAYYSLQTNLKFVEQMTQKLFSIKDDVLLEKDPDCMEAKILIAKQFIKKNDWFEKDAHYEERLKLHVRESITISELRKEWPKILRSRYLYENVYFHDRIMDEIALARLNLPRFKEQQEKARYEIPDTSKFNGYWTLPPISIEEWEKIVKERHLKLNQRIEQIKRNEMMNANQIIKEDVIVGTSQLPFFRKDFSELKKEKSSEICDQSFRPDKYVEKFAL